MLRKVHIDLLRILSIICVIFNHTGERGYFLFAQRTESVFYFPYMFASILCKIAVPIFFMISGALLLNKEESFFEVLKKRVWRILAVLVIASIPYYLWLHRNEGLGALDFFKTIYESCVTTSFWYLYSYLGILLMLPLLQKLAKVMTNKEFVYVMGGYIGLTGILPLIELILSGGAVNLNPNFSAALFTASNIVYVLTGYFLENRLKEEHFSTKNMIALGVVSIFFVVVTCVLTQLNISAVGLSEYEKVESYFNSFIIIPSFSVFFIVKGIVQRVNVPEKMSRGITTLGASVFGTYLIEKIVRAATTVVYKILNPYVGSFLAASIWVVVVASVSLMIITGLKKTPYVSRIVNMFI